MDAAVEAVLVLVVTVLMGVTPSGSGAAGEALERVGQVGVGGLVQDVVLLDERGRGDRPGERGADDVGERAGLGEDLVAVLPGGAVPADVIGADGADGDLPGRPLGARARVDVQDLVHVAGVGAVDPADLARPDLGGEPAPVVGLAAPVGLRRRRVVHAVGGVVHRGLQAGDVPDSAVAARS
jgi:hypothetical protein